MAFEIRVNPQPTVLAQERTCRYGHGPLTTIESIEGKKFFIVMSYSLENLQLDRPRYVGPFQWHLCATCGYVEMVDFTPDATIDLMKATT
jgi:hypothetical protein